MQDKIKIGIVGINPSHKSRVNHIRSFYSGIEILAASGSSQSDIVFAKNELGLQYVYSDHEQLTNNNDIDAVFIWSDASMHTMHTISAINANKHVMIDLPFGTNIDDCQTIIAAAKNRPSQTTFCPLKSRYNPIFIKANELIDSGEIGAPVMAQLYHGKKVIMSPVEKMSLQHRSIFIDLALDEIDLVRWMFGKEFSEVNVNGTIAQDRSLKMTNDVDTAQIQATLSGDHFIQMSLSRFPINSSDSRMFIQGTKASLHIDNEGLKIINAKGKEILDIVDHNSVPGVAELEIVKDFCEQILNRKKGRNTLEDAAATTKVAVAMGKSLIMNEKLVL